MPEQTARSSPNNILDLALAHFGPASEQDLYEAVRCATASDLDRFVDAYGAFASKGTTQAPLLKDGEIRPYFPTHDAAHWTHGGFTLDYHALKSEGGDWKAVDAIKHRLLYCHSVAFDDPMTHVASLAAAQIRLQNQGDSGMQALLNYVNLLLHFSELLRSQVVCTVSPESYLPGHRPGSMSLDQDLKESLKNSDLPDIDELLQAAPQDVQTLWRRELKDPSGNRLIKETSFVVACERISRATEGVNAAPGRLSMYLPFRYDVDILKRYPQSAVAVGAHNFPDRDNWLLDQLIDVELPNLESLTPRDILAVRAGSEFSEWRKVLKDALISANSIPSDIWNRELEVRKALDERLGVGKVKLEEAVSKSPALEGVKKGSVAMLAGLASAGVTCLLNPTSILMVMVLAAGAGATVSAIAEAVKNSGGGSKGRFGALAHYVAVLR